MTKWRTFQGRDWLFQSGLQQAVGKQLRGKRIDNLGHIRINVRNMGWDSAFAKLKEIPRSVQISLRSVTRRNAEDVMKRAQEMVPHGLETDRLHDSIETTPVEQRGADGWMLTVQANTPYAHFVEMGVHPKGGRVLGARQRAAGSVDQGPHFLQRASEELREQSQDNFRKAVERGINRAIGVARRGYSAEKLDFNTATGRLAGSFVDKTMTMGYLPSPGMFTGPLDMEIFGL